MKRSAIHEIFAQYPRSDKGTRHSYLDIYHHLLESRRTIVRSVLEIGVETGDSLRAWADYFPQAQILGVDNDLRCWTPGSDTRILVRHVDTTRPKDLERLARTFGPFDLVVDDGCHHMFAQIAAWSTLWPWVRHDGMYIIEDVANEYTAQAFVQMFGGQTIHGSKCEDDNLIILRME